MGGPLGGGLILGMTAFLDVDRARAASERLAEKRGWAIKPASPDVERVICFPGGPEGHKLI
jgi:hypothetical protein